MEVSEMPEWSLSPVRLVEPGAGEPFPLLLIPQRSGQSIPDFMLTQRQRLNDSLSESGAVLLRGFAVPDETAFERAAQSLCERLESGYGDLVKRNTQEFVYDATRYPNDRAILFHNEGSHTPRLPTRQLFFCGKARCQGGETPIVDCRRVLAGLDRELAQRFTRLGLSYIRNFIPGIDVSWQSFFRTTSRADVERVCRQSGVQYLWKDDGVLRIVTRAPAVIAHGRSGLGSFCNQILLHHVACLDAKTGAALRAVFDPDDLPRNVVFGDGSAISDVTVAEVLRVAVANATRFRWQVGDILLLDNLRVAHARSPYAGERQILVSIGDVVAASTLNSQGAYVEQPA